MRIFKLRLYSEKNSCKIACELLFHLFPSHPPRLGENPLLQNMEKQKKKERAHAIPDREEDTNGDDKNSEDVPHKKESVAKDHEEQQQQHYQWQFQEVVDQPALNPKPTYRIETGGDADGKGPKVVKLDPDSGRNSLLLLASLCFLGYLLWLSRRSVVALVLGALELRRRSAAGGGGVGGGQPRFRVAP